MQTQPTKNESKQPEVTTKTIVINRREAMIIGQLPHTGTDMAGRIILGPVVTFLPGVNVVDTAKLKTLRENKAFDARFSTKIVKTEGPDQPQHIGSFELVAGAEVQNEAGALKKMEPKEAAAVIEETFDARLLDKWLKDEGRDSVRAAIHEQKQLISTGKA